MPDNANDQTPLLRKQEKKELKESDAPEVLGFSFSFRRKWTILTVLFISQVYMNYNASVYGFCVEGVAEEFGVTKWQARIGQALYLICHGIGCELFAPWSEDWPGRFPVVQLSMTLVNCFSLLGALTPTFSGLLAARALGGLTSAGGSVLIGMVADFYGPADHQYASGFLVLASVGGNVAGSLAGPILRQYAPGWRWNFYSQLAFGLVSQLLHFVVVPETCVTVLLDREARRRRSTGEEEVYGPGEIQEDRFSLKNIAKIIGRPYYMLATEPIVTFLSLLSGFSDALNFIFIESFPLIYKQFGITDARLALAFIPLVIGYIFGWLAYFPSIHVQQKMRRERPGRLAPESRLKWLLYNAPLEPLGLLLFAWTSSPFLVGQRPWISMIFSFVISVANYSIYMTTIDYFVASYGRYAASASGGNALARDVLSGILTLFATSFYEDIDSKYRYQWASTILAALSLLVAIPAYIFYRHGQKIRERSAFASGLAKSEEKNPTEDGDE